MRVQWSSLSMRRNWNLVWCAAHHSPSFEKYANYPPRSRWSVSQAARVHPMFNTGDDDTCGHVTVRGRVNQTFSRNYANEPTLRVTERHTHCLRIIRENQVKSIALYPQSNNYTVKKSRNCMQHVIKYNICQIVSLSHSIINL